MKHLIALLMIVCLGLPVLVAAQGNKAVMLEMVGPIGPASSDYFERGLDKAVDDGASLLILRLDTPGGLDISMRAIISKILASPIPVITYVSPSGARAASAGTYIMYASHVSVMAPASHLGAATPVQVGGFSDNKPIDPSPADSKPIDPNAPNPQPLAKDKPAIDDTMKKKMVNDAVAYIKGLAKLRGRNEIWAELAVREAASLESDAALEQGVIDIIATDMTDLLEQLNGRVVELQMGDVTLDTDGMTIEKRVPDWRTQLLLVITDPNVAYLLMMIGIYGLIYEFINPGMILPGVAGTICIILALFAFQVLPINYTGLGLMMLGIAFMIGEVFVPSFGALGIGGMIAFVIGSIMLIDTDIPGYGVSPWLIGGFAFSSAALFMFVLGMAIRARNQPVVSGQEEMIGSIGVVVEDFDSRGRIHIHSEYWQVVSQSPLHAGDEVEVIAIDGLVLQVKPVDPANAANKPH